MSSGSDGGGHDPVEFHLEVDGFGDMAVESVQLNEGLNQLGTCVVRARCGAPPQAPELLRKECRLSVERRDQARDYKGIVRQANVSRVPDGAIVTVHVVPALWYLTQISTSRIHQHTTIPDLVSALVSELLGEQQRSVRDDTSDSHPVHDYLVQYQETYLDFLNRLCEMEGIFWYFDHEDEKEVMVLADSTTGLPAARDGDDAQVRFAPRAGHGQEAIVSVSHSQRVGPTDVVVAGHDWTRPSVAMGAERTGRGEEPALEVYDHTDAMTYHDYSEPAYGADTADLQAQMRAERLDLDRQHWSMRGSVVGARPGCLLELVNCPEVERDGRYLIVSVSSHGAANGGPTATYGNELRVVPAAVPYRPPRVTPRPVVTGYESAVVVTDGQEIQTDVHGRVKVQFHWDRLGENDDRSSCWLRVVENWAGDGFGTFFLPRKGMEVIVGFLGGDPDQPIVTGCVYNGTNRAGVELDAKKTQSLIRTKSSPDSDGYNEIRFEDDAGSEFISVHAQRNLLERVLNDHKTHVSHNQSNRVTGKQEVHVEGEYRHVHVDQVERYDVDGDRHLTVGGGEYGGMHEVIVHGPQSVEVDLAETYKVHGHRTVEIDQGLQETILQGAERIVQNGGLRTTVVGGTRHLSVGDHTLEVAGNQMVDATGNRSLTVGGTNTETATGVFTIEGDRVVIRANQKVVIDAPMGVDKIGGASNVESRDMFDFMAQQLSEIISAMKLSVVALSISETGIKIAQSGVAFSSTEFKIDRTVFKSELCDTVKIDAATLTVID